MAAGPRGTTGRYMSKRGVKGARGRMRSITRRPNPSMAAHHSATKFKTKKRCFSPSTFCEIRHSCYLNIRFVTLYLVQKGSLKVRI